MITDRFEYLDKYFEKGSRLYEAVSFARDFTAAMNDGKYVIDGDNIYGNTRTYLTKSIEEGKFENHREYIDVQVMIQGEEIMGQTSDTEMVSLDGYDALKDLQLFKQPETYSKVIMKPGCFTVLFPWDHHMPGCTDEPDSKVRKLVMKVKV